MIIFEENLFPLPRCPPRGWSARADWLVCAIFSTWFEPKPSHHFSNTHKASERPTQTFIQRFGPLSSPRFFHFWENRQKIRQWVDSALFYPKLVRAGSIVTAPFSGRVFDDFWTILPVYPTSETIAEGLSQASGTNLTKSRVSAF